VILSEPLDLAEVQNLHHEYHEKCKEVEVLKGMFLPYQTEVEGLREAFSRYGDHDRACAAREKSLYACTCGFVDLVNELFPSRAALAKEET
jgi:hypothetical protein